MPETRIAAVMSDGPRDLFVRVPWTPEVEHELIQSVIAERGALMPTLGEPGVRYFVDFRIRSDSAIIEAWLRAAGRDT